MAIPVLEIGGEGLLVVGAHTAAHVASDEREGGVLPDFGITGADHLAGDRCYRRGKENLTPACRTCNRSKGAQTPDQWGVKR